jgi:adenosylhomocysteinase
VLAVELIAKGKVKRGAQGEAAVFPVPEDIDAEVAKLKLKTLGLAIDKLTKEQQEYLASYEMGT